MKCSSSSSDRAATFLTWVEEEYGEETRRECQSILAAQDLNNLSPADVLNAALLRLHQEGLDEAKAAESMVFDSN